MARSRQKKLALLGPSVDAEHDVLPFAARRSTPDFVRATTLPMNTSPDGNTVQFNRKAIETRSMEASPEKSSGYTLWLVQHFDFIDGKQPSTLPNKATLLPERNLSYDQIITAMAAAMKGWRNEGFTSKITQAAPEPKTP